MVLLSILALSASALAQPRDGRGLGRGQGKGPMGPGHGMMMMGRCVLNSPDIGLTGEQKDAIWDIREEARRNAGSRWSEMKALMDGFMEAFANPEVTDGQLKEAHDAVRAGHRAMGDHRFETLLKVRAVLTPGQLEKVPAIAEDCRWNMPGPRYRGRNRRGMR